MHENKLPWLGDNTKSARCLEVFNDRKYRIPGVVFFSGRQPFSAENTMIQPGYVVVKEKFTVT